MKFMLAEGINTKQLEGMPISYESSAPILFASDDA
jgi:hypothetical protein